MIYGEAPEARNLHLLPPAQAFLDYSKDRLHHLPRFLLRGANPLVDQFHEIGFGHALRRKIPRAAHPSARAIAAIQRPSAAWPLRPARHVPDSLPRPSACDPCPDSGTPGRCFSCPVRPNRLHRRRTDRRSPARAARFPRSPSVPCQPGTRGRALTPNRALWRETWAVRLSLDVATIHRRGGSASQVQKARMGRLTLAVTPARDAIRPA